MNIALMRRLDFYLGIPLTWLLTLLLKAKRLVLPVKAELPPTVKSILFVELSEMGSMIQLMPMIDQTRKTFPDARLYFVTFKSSSPILHVIRNIDKEHIWTLDSGSLGSFLRDGITLTLKLLTTRFDICFDLELFSRTSSLIAFCSGARLKAGFHNYMAEGLYRGDFLTHPVTYNPHLPISKNFMGMLYALRDPVGAIPHCKQEIGDEAVTLPAFALPEGAVEAFRTRLYASFPQLQKTSTLVILNPNSSETLPLRRWPMDKYVELTRLLLRNPDVSIVITGAPSERADAAYICSRVDDTRVIDLSGFTSMQEVVALYAIASLMITNDSGPAQFAALVKLPTITFFGPETPDLYGSLNPNAYNFFKRLHCSPCYTAQNNRTSPCTNNVCMQMIGVEEVIQKAEEMLGKRYER